MDYQMDAYVRRGIPRASNISSRVMWLTRIIDLLQVHWVALFPGRQVTAGLLEMSFQRLLVEGVVNACVEPGQSSVRRVNLARK